MVNEQGWCKHIQPISGRHVMAKVLIVDDKESNLFALENILRRLDVEVVKALSGDQALCACLNHAFALAILDVQMPAIRIIGLSMESDPICEKHMREAGAADFRDKNCSACDLLSAIRDCGRGCSQRGPDKANLLA
jgi:CheY-like chemotaxis protein